MCRHPLKTLALTGVTSTLWPNGLNASVDALSFMVAGVFAHCNWYFHFIPGTSKSYRRRKARTVFSDHQLQGLEKRFETQRYLSTPERIDLANSLALSETQVSQTINL
jgi:hypothetical protein